MKTQTLCKHLLQLSMEAIDGENFSRALHFAIKCCLEASKAPNQFIYLRVKAIHIFELINIKQTPEQRIQTLNAINSRLKRSTIVNNKACLLYSLFTLSLEENHNLQTFIFYAQNALQAIENENDPKLELEVALVKMYLGDYYLSIDDYQLAESFLNSAIQDMKQLWTEDPKISYCLALSRYKLGLCYFFMAEEISVRKNTLVRALLISRPFVHEKAYYGTAWNLMIKAQQNLETLSNEEKSYWQELSWLLSCKAVHDWHHGLIDEAQTLFLEYIDIYEELIQDPYQVNLKEEGYFHLALSYHYLGLLELNKGEIYKALIYFVKADDVGIKKLDGGFLYWKNAEYLHYTNYKYNNASFTFDDILSEIIKDFTKYRQLLVQNASSLSSRQFLIQRNYIDKVLDQFLSILFYHFENISDEIVNEGISFILYYRSAYWVFQQARHKIEREPSNEHDHARLSRVQNARRAYTRLCMSGPESGIADYKSELFQLALSQELAESEFFQEKELSEKTEELLGKNQLVLRLPENTLFLQFNSFKNHGEEEGMHQYLLILAYRSSENQRDIIQKMVNLGSQQDIDGLVNSFSHVIQNYRSETKSRKIQFDSKDSWEGNIADKKSFKASSQALYKRLLGDIESLLQVCNNLWIATEASLNQLPFEALIDSEGKFMLQTHQIEYRLNAFHHVEESKELEGEPLVISDPTYHLSDTSEAYFLALPGAKMEGEKISSLSSSKLIAGISATKEEVLQHKRPLFLHLSTHGFLIPPQLNMLPDASVHDPDSGLAYKAALGDLQFEWKDKTEWLTRYTPMNPDYHASLALAGAGSWIKGEQTPHSMDTGLLTAGEIRDWDLRATRLVTLSACVSGVSVHIESEKDPNLVIDPRIIDSTNVARADKWGLFPYFFLAGAKAMISSLWEIDDKSTQHFMERFYTLAIQEDLNIGQALRQTKLEMLQHEKWNTPYYWAGLIGMGDMRQKLN